MPVESGAGLHAAYFRELVPALERFEAGETSFLRFGVVASAQSRTAVNDITGRKQRRDSSAKIKMVTHGSYLVASDSNAKNEDARRATTERLEPLEHGFGAAGANGLAFAAARCSSIGSSHDLADFEVSNSSSKILVLRSS